MGCYNMKLMLIKWFIIPQDYNVPKIFKKQIVADK